MWSDASDPVNHDAGQYQFDWPTALGTSYLQNVVYYVYCMRFAGWPVVSQSDAEISTLDKPKVNDENRARNGEKLDSNTIQLQTFSFFRFSFSTEHVAKENMMTMMIEIRLPRTYFTSFVCLCTYRLRKVSSRFLYEALFIAGGQSNKQFIRVELFSFFYPVRLRCQIDKSNKQPFVRFFRRVK